MNRQWIVVASVVAVVVAFIAGAVVFKGRETQQVSQAAQSNSDALVRASSPVFGNPAAKVTIVEFFDPACETCRAFYPLVKTIVNSSFGQVRLVVRHAPLHQGSDTAVKILEAARMQGQYWPAVERALAGQPQWAAHGNARPELIWDLITDLGLDMAKLKADMGSPEVAALIKQDLEDAVALNVAQTPEFFVNGRPMPSLRVSPLASWKTR